MPKDSFFNTEDSKSMGILNLLNKELETNDYIEIPKHVKISKDPKWWIFTVLSFAGIFLGISIANFQRQIPLLEKTRDDLKTSITKRVATLDELSAQISPELISLYEKIRETQDGVGAARLAGDSCDGCHLKLNAAELEKIKSLPEDEVVRCEECRRVLIRVK